MSLDNIVSSPATNAAFLSAIFGAPTDGITPWVCGFEGNPKERTPGRWSGWPSYLVADGPGLNWYFTLGVFRAKRAHGNCAAIYGVLADDIGTKAVPRSRLDRLPPASLIETSPGNFQALYLFSQAQTDISRVEALQRAMIAAHLSDPDALSPATRYCRMPHGVNGKTSPPTHCRLVEWHPERRYSIDDIVHGLGLQIDPCGPARHAAPVAAWEARSVEERAAVIAEVRSALGCIAMDSRSDYVGTGQYLKSMGDDGRALWVEAIRKSTKYRDGDEDAWDGFGGDRSDYRAVFTLAASRGWVNPRSRHVQNPTDVFAVPQPLPSGASLTPIPPAGQRSPSQALTPTQLRNLSFSGASGGMLPATIEGVFDTLREPSQSGYRIALDAFLEQIMIDDDRGQWRPFTDGDYGRLRANFGRRGFKPISAEIMKTAVLMTAEDHRFDSLKDWANSLEWDSVPRIEAALPTYYRTADTSYTRAVGAYLFTALAGRALAPGCQADMIVVLVGVQGARKTSAVRALAPDERFFAEINLKKLDDDDLARRVRGKVVGEIAELRGLQGRDSESVKAWITRREEVWRPVYREFETTYPRRLVFVGTANEREFLNDPTGERRWLPVEAGAVDVESLERDCTQLWAEGVARFKSSGIAWRDAEALARAEHDRFKLTDPWQDSIEAWLQQPSKPDGPPWGAGTFRLADVAAGAIVRPLAALGMAEQKRIAAALRNLGFEKDAGRINGTNGKLWRRVALPLPPV
jgi:hypothetical protein